MHQHQLRKAVQAISMAEQHLKQAVDKHRIAHEAGEAAAVKASPARVLETVGTMMKHYQTIAVCCLRTTRGCERSQPNSGTSPRRLLATIWCSMMSQGIKQVHRQ